MKSLYRILNENEQYGIPYDTGKHVSPRKQAVIRLWQPLMAVCTLSVEAGITLLSAHTLGCNLDCLSEAIRHAIRNGDHFVSIKSLGLTLEKTKYMRLEVISRFHAELQRYYNAQGVLLEPFMAGYLWEVVWESVRRQRFAGEPSRLSSAFFFSFEADAFQFKDIRGPLAVMGVARIPEDRCRTYDMSWLDLVPENSTYDQATRYAMFYWLGEYTDDPVPEVLVSGTYTLEKPDNLPDISITETL